ncbi:MAG: hypothetical protein Q7V01_15035, partial [Vicinamibacterales bacterium]|nr:hypothetical protein [Vicinamibacterales bacterium]
MTSDLSALSSVNSGYRHDSLLHWLSEANPEALEQLWQSADRTRSQFVGGETGIWGGIKLS